MPNMGPVSGGLDRHRDALPAPWESSFFLAPLELVGDWGASPQEAAFRLQAFANHAAVKMEFHWPPILGPGPHILRWIVQPGNANWLLSTH